MHSYFNLKDLPRRLAVALKRLAKFSQPPEGLSFLGDMA